MSNKTALEKIVAYLRSRKTGATAPEIAKGAKVNYNTTRKELGNVATSFSNDYGIHHAFGTFKYNEYRKCRVTGKHLTTYSLA